ncbi:MAG: hypothetical protein K1X72_16015 [Pyrinomonadaceae bacterium]|nr:hypothetical protein [Pyrinomonadaceae bacterium]
MRKINQIFLLLFCFCLCIIQAAAQTNSIANETNQNSINQNILSNYEKSGVQVKQHWKLINKYSGKQLYFLYVSVKTLKEKGVKTISQAEAVPVYVETETSFEPILVENKGQYNVPVEQTVSEGGFVATKDGYIITSLRAAAPWNSGSTYVGTTIPPGIIMSSDLKKIKVVDSTPPVDWIPSHTQPQRGMVGNFGIKANFDYKNTKNETDLSVLIGRSDRPMDAKPIMSSGKEEIGLIKVDLPGELNALELNDNYDSLNKGSADNFIIKKDANGLKVMKTSVVAKGSFDWGTTIQLGNSFSETEKENKANQSLFNSGNPVFDGKGRVIGIYQSFNSSDQTHFVIPIKFGKELLN